MRCFLHFTFSQVCVVLLHHDQLEGLLPSVTFLGFGCKATEVLEIMVGDRFLSSGENCALPMRVPNPIPVLHKNRALIGPEMLYITGAGVKWKAPKAFPNSNSVLDKFQSVTGGPKRNPQ